MNTRRRNGLVPRKRKETKKFSIATDDNAKCTMSVYNQKQMADRYPYEGYKLARVEGGQANVESFCAIHERLPHSVVSFFRPTFA